jgi:hypothetical protein
MSSTIKFRCLDDSGNNIFLIDSDSGVYSSSTKDSTNSSSGSVLLYGGLSINATTNATSITSGGGLTIAGGASINKELYIGGDLYAQNVISTQNMTIGNINFTGNLYQNGILFEGGSGTSGSNISGGSGIFNTITTQSINLGVSNYYSGSFSINNDVSIPSNVTGFSFSSSIRSFTSVISISILRSVGGNLFQYITLEGHKTDNGWSLYTARTGDVTNVLFTITSDGQIQYVSGNQPNFISGTLRFTVSQISDTGTYSVMSETGGSYLIDYLQINSTENSILGTSNGGLYVLGGATISKSLHVNNVRIGTTNVFASTCLLDNNKNVPTDIPDLSFDNGSILSFNIQGNITIVKSVGENLSQTVNMIGHRANNSWELYLDTIGDTTGVTFNITNSGQIQYTTTNQTNFVSNTFHFYVSEISNSGTYSKLSNTIGSYVVDSIQVNNTTDAVSGISNGGVYILGGMKVSKSIVANQVDSVTFTGGNLSLSGDIKIAGTLTTVNITTTNLIDTNISAGSLIATTIVTQNATVGNLYATGNYIGIGTDVTPSYYLQLGVDSAAKPSTNTWTVSSDARLKTNITAANLNICYDNIKNIPLKRYTWRDEVYTSEQVQDRSKLGWIAQDVETVIPKAVEQKDLHGISDCRTLNSDQIIASLYGCVQKLISNVEGLQLKVESLESELAQLKQKTL